MKEYPKSVPEAVNQLLMELSDADKLTIKNIPEGELDRFHLTLGNYVRNEFGLWGSNVELLGDCLPEGIDLNPDHASSVIIKALWKSLQATA